LSSYITITTDAASVNLPATGYRTNPSYVAFMPRFQSPGGGSNCVTTEASANHYKFQHINFLNVPQGFNVMVALGTNDTPQQFKTQEPSFIVIDQCYFKGDPVAGQKRAIECNGISLTISN